MEPYPELLRSGPRATWMADEVPGVTVRTFSGLPLSPLRRQFSDLRDMLRYTGAQLGSLGTVEADASILRVYGAVAALAHEPERQSDSWRRATARAASKVIVAASRGVSIWETTVLSPIKNRTTSRVEESSGHLTVHRSSAMGNSLHNQMAVIRDIAQGPTVSGVVFVTSSAYVDVRRIGRWVEDHSEGIVIGGSNARASVEGDSGRFLSGFCQYFSWEAIQMLACARNLDHGLLNDEALSAWLVAHGHRWIDPGIVWSTEELELGRCPLCEDSHKTVVRCTSHGSRHREAAFMSALHHEHGGRAV